MSRFKYMGIASKWRFFLFVVLMVEYLLFFQTLHCKPPPDFLSREFIINTTYHLLHH